jgi:hypothetical protein
VVGVVCHTFLQCFIESAKTRLVLRATGALRSTFPPCFSPPAVTASRPWHDAYISNNYMCIWTTQKLQKTKNNWGSAFPDIITGFGFRNAVDSCSNFPAQCLIRLVPLGSCWHRPLRRNVFIHNRPRLRNRNLGHAFLIFLLMRRRQLPSLPMLLPPSNQCLHHKKKQCFKLLRDISKSLSNGFQLRFWVRCSSTTCLFSVPTSSSSCFHIRSPKLRCTAECSGFW